MEQTTILLTENTLTTFIKLIFALNDVKSKEEIFKILENNASLLKLVILLVALKDSYGPEWVFQTAETNPTFFRGLFTPEELAILKILGNLETSLNKKDLTWTDSNAAAFVGKLNISKMQAILIQTMGRKNDNKGVTLEELEKEFKSKGIEIHTGSMIGGSLAGITKKCNSYELPQVFRNFKDDKDVTRYCLKEDAKIILKYLNV